MIGVAGRAVGTACWLGCGLGPKAQAGSCPISMPRHENVTSETVHLLWLKNCFIGPILFAGNPLAHDWLVFRAGLGHPFKGYNPENPYIPFYRTDARSTLSPNPSGVRFSRSSVSGQLGSSSESDEVRFQLFVGCGDSCFKKPAEATWRLVVADFGQVIGQCVLCRSGSVEQEVGPGPGFAIVATGHRLECAAGFESFE